MSGEQRLIQEKIATKADSGSPEYHLVLQAYVDDPLHDMNVPRPLPEAPDSDTLTAKPLAAV